MHSRTTFFAFTIFLMLFSLNSFAQDTIFYFAGGIDVGKVLSINDQEIRFNRLKMPDGPVYSVAKNKVSLIIYANGSSELFEVTDPQQTVVKSTFIDGTTYSRQPSPNAAKVQNAYEPPPSDLDLARLGRIDAQKFYQGHRTVGTVTLLGMIYPPIGIIAGGILLFIGPNESSFVNPDKSLFNFPEYKYSYKMEAEKMRRRSILRNVGVGAAAWVFIFIIAISSL